MATAEQGKGFFFSYSCQGEDLNWARIAFCCWKQLRYLALYILTVNSCYIFDLSTFLTKSWLIPLYFSRHCEFLIMDCSTRITSSLQHLVSCHAHIYSSSCFPTSFLLPPHTCLLPSVLTSFLMSSQALLQILCSVTLLQLPLCLPLFPAPHCILIKLPPKCVFSCPAPLPASHLHFACQLHGRLLPLLKSGHKAFMHVFI